jgi:TonB-dependent receptor
MKKMITPLRWQWLNLAYLLLLGFIFEASAQHKNPKVSLNLQNVPVSDVFARLEKQTELQFVYSSNHINPHRLISLQVQDVPVSQVLDMIIEDKNINVQHLNNKVVLSHKTKVGQGIVKGKVIDSENKEPLPGVSVVIFGTNQGAVTDIKGEYTIAGVNEGKQTLEVIYIGYQTLRVDVDVKPNQVNIQNFTLQADVIQAIEVTGNVEGQTRALNQQKNADNIVTVISADLISRFPDLNVGEALQRVPGINIERDRGEGGVVQLRGVPPNFSIVTINGEQIPGSQPGGERNEELSVFPVDQLSSIEVFKSITPDQDGDAIGGIVNMRTPTAKSLKSKAKIELGGGYNNISTRFNGIGRASWNKRFFPSSKVEDGRLGVYVGGSYFANAFGRDRTQYIYNPTPTTINGVEYILPNRYTLRDLNNDRVRTGVAATLDFKFNERHEIYSNLMYSRRFDEDRERRVRYDLPAGSGGANWDFTEGSDFPNINKNTTMRRFLNPRTAEVNNYTVNFGGKHDFNKFSIDYLAFGSFTSNLSNNGRQYDLRSSPFSVTLNDIGSIFLNPTATDPNINIHNPFLINRWVNYTDRFEDIKSDVRSARLNVTVPYALSKGSGIVKFGGKYRVVTNRRIVGNRQFSFDATGFNNDALYASLVADQEDQLFMRNRIRFGSTLDAAKADAFIAANADRFEFNERATRNAELPSTYTAEEKVTAGYLMTRYDIGKLRVLAGLRYERTQVGYTANQYRLDGNNDIIPESVVLIQGGPTYDNILPNLQFRYAVDDLMNLRLAVTQSFGRANFADLVPRQAISINNLSIDEGNPNLKAAKALNIDFLAEKYLSNVGVLSAGFFYKRLDNFIFRRVTVEQFTFTDPVSGDVVSEEFRFTRPDNGNVAHLGGIELNVQYNLDFLPKPFSGLSIVANYTGTLSQGSTFDRKDVRLIGQPNHTANFALFYDYKRFTARVMFNYNGATLRAYGPTADFDIIRDNRYQLDVSASVKITKKLRLFGEFINLTNQPEIEILGSRSRPSNVEFYDWWNRFGVSYSF